ncbi:Eco57I restriction-modification methylase domain-containing protein [Polaribacter aestuariivivens]|uniref:Eco57I restriction-modification methylase domain-containing protein n=1 Tax=Polaribacter aestuariivivens TaxID=2304626 RepID=UPI003F4984D2
MESILSQIFTSDYNRTSFEDNVLKPVFLNSVKDFVLYDEDGEQEVELTDTEKRTAKKVVKYGEFKTHDNRKIELYEVTVEDFRQVKIARVGLGALVKKLIIGNNAVFATFKYEDVTNKHWRFSFIAYDSFFEEGQVLTKETNPKRYTYVFGDEDETYRTAIDRFKELDSKFQIKVKDIQDAFAVEAMSKEFFDEYRETHYAKFVKFLTGEEFQKKGGKFQLVEVQNPSPFLASVFNGDKKEARDFCKKLLGQIVFLYFIQKKGWLGATDTNYKEGNGDKNFIQNFYKQAGENDTFYPLWLSKLFYDTLNQKRTDDDFTMPDGKVVKIPYLNGGLFEKESEKFDHLVFPSELFTDLFEFFNRFNFTIYENSPEEHTIAVDPEMLGHIFENLLEDNKDKGAFYTPKEIVQYMTQESLIEYLVTHLGENAKNGISQFVKQKDKEALTDTQLNEINNLLDKVKICDPAIGSGAFPMGLLHEIFALKERIAFDLGFKVWSPATVKENIIQNSIYGVDIEKGAVDIAQLRFWLSLIVDEEEPKPLPNLAYKIVVGNSLVSKFGDEIIEIDWEVDEGTQSNLFGNPYQEDIQDLLKQISEKQKEYFTANNRNKPRLTKEIRLLKLEILSKQLELMINTKGFEKVGNKRLSKPQTERWLETEGWKRTLQQVNTLKTNNKPFNHFDWRLDFPEILNPIVTENTGFDIVIGNPPYIKEYTSKEAFDGFRNSDYYQGKMDLWYGFACISIDLLKEKGVECFIAQNNWITSAGASIFRNKVIQETKIKLFTDFWNYKVFKSAGIQTMIYLLKKEIPVSPYSLKYSLLNDDTIKESELENFLNFDNEVGVDEKYILDFDSNLYYDSLITFNNPRIDNVLNTIILNEVEFLRENEIAQGIVPNPDVVNSRNIKKIPEEKVLSNNINVGDGVFVINNHHELNKSQSNFIKPLIEPTETGRYLPVDNYSQKILYLTKSNSQNVDSDILEHLEKYREIMDDRRENLNGRLDFFHLHWPRVESYFESGAKILSVRKCDVPSFTYTESEIYVMMAFNIIKSDRFDLKYLTSLLNSKLIAFWLRFKGKMQGNNYQVDKEPLVNIPIINTSNIKPFTILADYLIFLHNPNTPQANSFAKNKSIAKAFEDLVDMMVYELYFKQHMHDLEIDVIQFIDTESIFNSISELKDEKLKAEIIGKSYTWLNEENNPIRNRTLLSNIHSKEIIALINTNTI